MNTSFNWKIAGAAGEGIKKAGLIFAKTCFKHGLSVHGYTEYPSLIRGGHNTFQIHASAEDVFSPQFKLDILVGIHEKATQYHQSEITPETITLSSDNLPLMKLVKQVKAHPKMKNMAALGASVFLLGLSLDTLKQTLAEVFAKKGQPVVQANHQVAQAGYDFASQNFKTQAKPAIPAKTKTDHHLFLTGNQALSYGAIAGGLKLYVAYPMTPATSILHTLAAKAKAANIIVRHAEDEIGTVNMAIGAGFAGVRSMVGTSGGGFSLMTEGLGLSGITETPLVIVNAMRPGPASGMPTWSSQGDLLYAIHASQDEFPRLVLTPGDPQECFQLAKLAQNLAEKYQLPVIILTDKYLGESYFTINKPTAQHQNQRYGLINTQDLNSDQPFKRYQDTDTGVSPRPLPGQPNGVHLCNSYEHDELGYATEDSSQRIKQVNKRAKKTAHILKDPDFVNPQLYGPKTADQTLISWGSNKGVILQALKQLKNTNFIHFPIVWPFPTAQFQTLTKTAKKLITLECNSTGQLNQLIRQQTGLTIKDQLLKYDGRPFFPQELQELVEKLS